MAKQTTAILRAHDIAAQVDIQVLHGGLPAHAAVSYMTEDVDEELLSLIEGNLTRMGYVTERRTDRSLYGETTLITSRPLVR